MIKFFRKIRHKLIEEKKIGNYLKYAIGEILLVMIGILLALQVNNWNEIRKNKISEQFYLSQLKENLQQDSVNIIIKIKQLEKTIVHMDSALLMLNAPEHFHKGRFIDYISRLMVTNQMKPNRAIYDNLITSGNIGLLVNRSLTEKLFKYYDPGNSSHVWDDALVHYTRNVFGPFLLTLDDYTPSGVNVLSDGNLAQNDSAKLLKAKLNTMADENKNSSISTYNEYRNNTKIKNYITYKYQLTSGQKLLYNENVLNEIIKLLQIIESEIDNK